MELQKHIQCRIEKIFGYIIYIDIDQTLCVSNVRDKDNELDYLHSTPIQVNIDIVNALFEHNTIILFTARGNRTKKRDWRDFTKNQMLEWGIKFHDINFDKPHYDVMICDKAVNNFDQFFFYLKAGPDNTNKILDLNREDSVIMVPHGHSCTAVKAKEDGILSYNWRISSLRKIFIDVFGKQTQPNQPELFELFPNAILWYEMDCFDSKCPGRKRFKADILETL